MFSCCIIATVPHFQIFTDVGGAAGAALQADFINQEDSLTNSFSMTWSYQTSDEPMRAGPESDVFVVPNLNVMYEEVFIVAWDDEDCKPALVERKEYYDGSNITEFETTVLFNVQAPESQPALSFYSRYHINLVKIPELADSIAAMNATIDRVENEEIICCPDEVGSCLGVPLDEGEVYRKCDKEDLDNEKLSRSVLQDAELGWKEAIEDADKAKNNAIAANDMIASWFDNSDVADVYPESLLRSFSELVSSVDPLFTDSLGTVEIDDEHTSKTALAPNTLIEKSQMSESGQILLQISEEDKSILDEVKDAVFGEDDDYINEIGKGKIRETKRLQIAGDAGTYELTLSQQGIFEFQEQNCILTAPVSIIAGASLALGSVAVLAVLPQFALVIPIIAGAAIGFTARVGCNFELELFAKSDLHSEGKIGAVATEIDNSLGKHEDITFANRL